MELFVTIGICKVISCRLMIMYIQYCPMSVFICVCPLLVPFCSSWFHLQISEMVLFVTITIAYVYSIGQWCWTHNFFLLISFFFVISLLSSSRYRWGDSSLFQLVHVVPVRFRWFQLVLGVQLVAGSSSSFQVVPACFSF